MEFSADIKKIERHFLPKDFTVETWDGLEPYYKNLLDRPINSKQDLEQWLKDMSEVDAVVGEDAAWRQIRMTCDTESKELEQAFAYFMMEILPKIQPIADQLNRKLLNSPFTKELDQQQFFTYLRSVRNSVELFREANVPIQAEVNVAKQQFGIISGKMSVEVNGKEYTLQQAAKFLESPDRRLREEVYRKMFDRRVQDKNTLNHLFTELVTKRDQIAKNAGFTNYRDYKFAELGRFDYTKEDCYQFHESVKQYVLPLVNELNQQHKEKLGLDTLRPWDNEAEPEGILPLRPFEGGEELLEKSVKVFERVRPFFADCLRRMHSMNHLDLDSRKGKAPGGYNCPLPETGAPFIFMNAAGQMHDVTTMLHEGGHAVHSFLTHNLELSAFKEYPMEIAEVASMAMELLTMDNWEIFFDKPEDLKRARQQQLDRTISIFPWIATIDKFQHWVYENPQHTEEERAENWMRILTEFTSPVVDYSGLEEYRKYGWQSQLHLYEVPFYYIEYGIAQLGAIGLWKLSRQDKEKTLDNYIKALSLGGTRTLPELYKTAGIEFNFSGDYIRDLMAFVHEEWKKTV